MYIAGENRLARMIDVWLEYNLPMKDKGQQEGKGKVNANKTGRIPAKPARQ